MNHRGSVSNNYLGTLLIFQNVYKYSLPTLQKSFDSELREDLSPLNDYASIANQKK